jgi:hypothetical protein
MTRTETSSDNVAKGAPAAKVARVVEGDKVLRRERKRGDRSVVEVGVEEEEKVLTRDRKRRGGSADVESDEAEEESSEERRRRLARW